jgi:outer membrane protein insertion porin family
MRSFLIHCTRALLPVLAGWGVFWALPAAAQAPLHLINEETEVRNISFNFTDSETFPESRLKDQIATTEPSFMDKVRAVLPILSPRPHPFDPVELQRDVIRLQRFYRTEGFLHTTVDYRASQLDTTDNTIHVILSVTEGPPLVIQDVEFVAPDGSTAFYQFPEEIRPGWIELRDEITVRTGDRFTDFDLLRIRDEATRWLQNQGYAFADVEGDADIDSLDNVVDLSFLIDAGPIAYVDSIVVEGNESVPENVILRELPFKEGDPFSASDLLEGERELSALNVFRVAVTDVPDTQPRDSTVTVVVRVREAQPRYVSAEVGYARENGAEAQGQWTHRNFLGGARTFSAGLLAESGLGATPVGGYRFSRTFRGTLSLRQPYLFSRKLSGIVAPFVEYRRDPLQSFSGEFLDIGTRELGNTTTLIYEFLPFRPLTLQHTYVRALVTQNVDVPTTDTLFQGTIRDPHNRSILSLNSTIGDVDDFIAPSNGWLLRPFAETGGTLLGSDIEYYKLGSEAVGYRQLTSQYSVAARLFAGRVWPFGRSKQALFGRVSLTDSLRFEQRFDPILFYAGGSTLRGWGFQLAGKKDARVFTIPSDEEGTPPDTLRFYYEPRGGTALFGANLEARMPFPGLGENWSSAVFFDAAMLDDDISFSNIFANIGAGIRFETIVGFIRFDLAYKLNPTFEDLRRPRDVYYYERGLGPRPPESWRRRFNLQLSIGQAF